MRILPSRTYGLSFVQRYLLVGLATFVLLPVGCRSTRSGLATLPGMSWVGPRDESISLGSWDESDGPSLPPPSQDATPQIASQSTDGKDSASDRRKSYPLDPKPQMAERRWGQESNGPESDSVATDAYPDTGYPAPFGDSPQDLASDDSMNQAARSDIGSYASKTDKDIDTTVGADPDRGFYGDELSADSASDAEGTDEATTFDTRQNYSRYATEEFDGASSTLGEDLADDRDSSFESQPDDSHFVDEPPADSQFGDVSDSAPQTTDNFDGSDTETSVYDLAGTDESADAAHDLLEATDEFAGGQRDAGTTVQGLRDRVGDFGQTARSAVDAAQERLGDGYDSAQQTLGNATKPLKNAYGQAAKQGNGLLDRGRDVLSGLGPNQGESPREPLDRFGAAAEDLVEDHVDADDLDIAAPYNTNAAPDSRSAPPRRSEQQWRPGSTSDYEGRLEQTRNRSPYGVAPAYYGEQQRTSDRRLVAERY